MIEIKDMSVCYDGTIQALKELTLSLDKKKIGIIGENGSGKSTLLGCLVGLNSFTGKITIDGEDVNESHLSAIRNKIGFVFQNPDHQLFMNTVREDISFGPLNQGYSQEETKAKVENIAERLQISSLLDRSPDKLSGGQKSMCAIATVLVMEPEILLLDEPSSSLDPKSRRRLIHLLKDLDLPFLMATHDLDMALDLCEDLVLLEKGQLISHDEAKKILKNKTLLEDHGLELPLSYQGGTYGD